MDPHRPMYPIAASSRLIRLPLEPTDVPPAAVQARPGTVQVETVALDAFKQVAQRRQEVRFMLECGDLIDGYARHVTLLLIPQLPEWPSSLDILLHSNGSAPARRYAPPDAQGEVRDSLHVKQVPDGRYVVAVHADVPPHCWNDCGLDVFDAVLGAMRLHTASTHAAFTAGKGDMPEVDTDSQWLRKRLAGLLGEAPPACMQALATTTPLPQRRPDALREIDAWMLRDIAGLSRTHRTQIGTLDQLADLYRVKLGTLKYLVAARTYQPTDAGDQFIRKQEDPHFRIKPITPAILQEVAAMVPDGIKERGGRLLAVANGFPVSVVHLRRLVDPRRGLTAEGRNFLVQRGVYAALPIEAPDFDDMLRDMPDDEFFGWGSPANAEAS